jgi:hypothetical protein
VVSECVVEASAEDEGCRELDEGVVELGSDFPTGREAALVVEPSVRAFDRPALAGEWVSGASLPGPAFVGDPRLDLAFPQRLADVFGVVAAVGQEPVGTTTAAAPQRGDLVNESDRLATVVLVRGADQGR